MFFEFPVTCSKKNIPPISVLYGFSEVHHGQMAFPSGVPCAETLKRRLGFLGTLPLLNAPPLFTVKQVHGNKVVLYEDGRKYPAPTTGDAIITQSGKVAIGVLTADCLPVILYSISSTVIGVIHAGRVGSLNQITGVTVKKIIDDFDADPAYILAVVGPGILKCCYEVGREALNPFGREYDIEEIATRCSENKWKLDLVSVNVKQIISCGVPSANVYCTGLCTMCGTDFFSFRRSGNRERFLSIVSLGAKRG